MNYSSYVPEKIIQKCPFFKDQYCAISFIESGCATGGHVLDHHIWCSWGGGFHSSTPKCDSRMRGSLTGSKNFHNGFFHTDFLHFPFENSFIFDFPHIEKPLDTKN
jgi:hypothetical protein